MMTESDAADFADTDNYFASSRSLISVRYNLPVLEYYTLSLEALFQFDLNGAKDFNGNKDYLHSQYGKAMIEFFPQNKAGVAVGALLQAMESNDGFNAAFGALARFRMDLPTSFDSGIRVTWKFTSGPSGDTAFGFTPISSHAQGLIFSQPLAGLSLISADYTARITNSLLADAALLYFIQTYKDPVINGNLYGCEMQASLAWQPLDDIRMTLGGGLFFPALGNIYTDTQTLWKIKASIMLAL